MIHGHAGGTDVSEPAGETGLIFHCTWDEQSGINAIGTSLSLQQPVETHGFEHLRLGIEQWMSLATVIRDPLLGRALDVRHVFGLAQTHARHSVAFIVPMDGRIESRLGKPAIEGRLQLVARFATPYSARADGVIVVDDVGHIVPANPQAAVVLNRLGISESLEGALPIPDFIWQIAAGSTSQQGAPGHCRAGINMISGRTETPSFPLMPPPASRRAALLPDFSCTAARKLAPAFSRIVGTSPALCTTIQKARQLAELSVPVLLVGESGVGKGLFAHGIHQASERAEGPFIALHCGGIPCDLLTRELFGYAEGAFTDACKSGMKGKIEAANHGTLFLDEIGEVPLDVQPFLLRVLEDGEVCRLGENAARKVDFRLIAATNHNLCEDVTAGKFRMDFYYWLSMTSLTIDPLRDRKDDLKELIDHWLHVLRERYGMVDAAFDDAAYAGLLNYSWPGNVRELRNAIEYALLMSRDRTITLNDLPLEVSLCAPHSAGTQATSSFEAGLARPKVGSLKMVEAEAIRTAILQSEGNLTHAAALLGIAKSTLYRKMGKYALNREPVDRRRSMR
ncbi:sigma-54-dependent Fis family transcriptional regulator [Paraburkholderia caledonica]|uniref:sigma-54-dependent Fis family transcriptional regulator n=1 Tax=Paraburkholderia caledonica TaxID=134536 RepID=UPI0038B7F7C2